MDEETEPFKFELGDWPPVNEGAAFSERVPASAAGVIVEDWFTKAHAASGSAEECALLRWRNRVEAGQILEGDTNGDILALGTRLRAGQQLTYVRRPWTEPPAPSHLHILYADDALLAVAKPSGLQVLPGGGVFCQRTVLGLLQAYHSSIHGVKYPKTGIPAPLHRLGRGTSGVLLCACTPNARRRLTQDFTNSSSSGSGSGSCSDHAVQAQDVPGIEQHARTPSLAFSSTVLQRPIIKRYRALVAGRVIADEGEVNVPIGRVPHPGLPAGLYAASDSGKPAASLFKVLQRRSSCTVVEVVILTGRPHQIRIHMAALGHPLVGDPLYGIGGLPLAGAACADHAVDNEPSGAGRAATPGECGYLLHSMQLVLTHPACGRRLAITAPPPDELRVPSDSCAELRGGAVWLSS